MGLLTDVIIASANDANAIQEARGGHNKAWSTLPGKDIDTIKLGTLWGILSEREMSVQEAANYMQDSLLAQRSDSGPWIYLVPAPLQSALAAIDDDKLDDVVETWSQTEEFKLDGWSRTDVEDYLGELVSLVKTAKSEGKSVLLWVSL